MSEALVLPLPCAKCPQCPRCCESGGEEMQRSLYLIRQWSQGIAQAEMDTRIKLLGRFLGFKFEGRALVFFGEM